MKMKIENLQHELKVLQKNYQGAFQIQELKNLTERVYCRGCNKELRELTDEELEEYNNILSSSDPKVAAEFKEMFKKHRKELVVYDKSED